MNAQILIRFAEEKDCALILDFVRGLAEYERLLDEVSATGESFRRFLFGEKKAEALICEYEGRPAGFALFFHTFSTFVGKPGIYIEDIFVKPEYRKRGLGKALLSFIAEIAVQRDCGRLEWACLDWNTPSRAFYASRGARELSEWTTYRLTGDGLKNLAAASAKTPAP
ncbi:MAG: GNAT family N-acetyltransferase [Spirochaetales bacterium]|jgi:GNAT superfamily N-acetyltransferase|nr:GNAT family N-acetyltransferase [Spirochaetales bacterium]